MLNYLGMEHNDACNLLSKEQQQQQKCVCVCTLIVQLKEK